MEKAPSREFQVFAKPAGPICNMGCAYCYYLEKEELFTGDSSFRMPLVLLEEYIVQHIEASTEPVISFSWHGGEPTILGLDYFREITHLQKKHKPAGKKILNGIQTNGTLLDREWCRFFSGEDFAVGVSMDGPGEFHDIYRRSRDGQSTFDRTLKAYRMLREWGVNTEVLCVVGAYNVNHPLEVYRYFRRLQASHLTFLPLVEQVPGSATGTSERSVPAEAFGDFLIAVFDAWKEQDIGRVKVQVFEEALRSAFGQDHTLCIFKKTCGGIPVLEHNGDFYSCDHYVNEKNRLGNILESPLEELLDSEAQKAFGRAKLDTLPGYCLECDVRDMCNGECPKNRFMSSPQGESGLNYLCPAYKKFFTHCGPFVEDVKSVWGGGEMKPES